MFLNEQQDDKMPDDAPHWAFRIIQRVARIEIWLVCLLSTFTLLSAFMAYQAQDFITVMREEIRVVRDNQQNIIKIQNDIYILKYRLDNLEE